MAPKTLTFDEIGSNAPSGAGLIGRPRRLPTKKGCGPCACCASNAPAIRPAISAAAPTVNVTRFICALQCCFQVCVSSLLSAQPSVVEPLNPAEW